MRVTLHDRHGALRRKLQEKLDGVARLRCDVHGLPVDSVVINAHENGWFDCRWTTCCEKLESAAATLLGTRCQ